MLDLRRESDPHSRTIYRDGKDIGFLQWSPSREHHVMLWNNCNSLTIKEMQYLIEQYDSIVINPTVKAGQ